MNESHLHPVFLFIEEKCRGFHTLTPGSEKGTQPHRLLLLHFCSCLRSKHLSSCWDSPPPSAAMMWLSLSLELMYIGLLLISCTLLSVQLCIRAWFPSTQRWGQMLNAFAAVFTVLGGAAVITTVASWKINRRKGFCFELFNRVWFIYPRRSTRDGGSHDVHAGVSDDCVYGTRRLQTSQLRLLLGFLVSKHTDHYSHTHWDTHTDLGVLSFRDGKSWSTNTLICS